MSDTLQFDQDKDGYKCFSDIIYNDNSINGYWFVRKTQSQKMWVVEYFNNNDIFLVAQTVYSNEKIAFDRVAQCATNNIVGENGKWDIVENTNPPAGYVINRIPESIINWA